ncbi:hypothetical protein QEZ54_09835 [Catellatospora sp. KI3]|uniref:hypothetical protein n=1 Tax=Catellatospora sp. KI3 TaxID=3041620 RepID=UPI00248294FA|nr:hypothetical protein [Catellatospora sp. KI3]MDI1461267.1 hypothetical protein [Catellatospora sp. KI3]
MEKRFRANPRYELHAGEQSAEPSEEPVYGYLRPVAPSSSAGRAVSADAALLFLTLRQAGPVPGYFRSRLGGRTDTLLLRLVLDGVLEVEHAGGFLSGDPARQVLLGDSGYHGDGPLARLSIEAVRYGEALGELPFPELTRRLYGFGRRPATAARKRAAPDPGRDRAARSRYWTPASEDEHWVMWRPLRPQDTAEQARFKLYISPDPSRTAEAFEAAADVLGHYAGARGLKLGRGPAGLTRPDKLVAYFSRLDDLHEAGHALHRRLAGCPVHGVPFSAELSPDGLLSWGADRPRSAPGQPASWRLWIAARLAAHLGTARTSGVRGALWQFALDRLRLDGVDTRSWAPTDEFWLSMAAPT